MAKPMVEEDPLKGLADAIKVLQSADDEDKLASRLEQLPKDDIRRLTRTKVSGVYGGKLTVLGYLCVKKSPSQALLSRLLTRENVDNLEEFDGHRIPLVNLAAYCGNEGAVEVIVRCNYRLPKARSGCGRISTLNAWHMAVKSGKQEVVNTVAYEERLTDEKDELGMTPLHYVAWEGNEGVTRGFFDAESDWKISVLDWNATERNGLTALHLACLNNNVSVIDELIDRDDLDVNAKDNNGFTALHIACWNNHLDCVKSLLSHKGINKNATDNHGVTASYLASRNHFEIMGRILGRLSSEQDVELNDATHELSLWRPQKQTIEAALDAVVPDLQISERTYAPPGHSMRESLRSDFEKLESPLFQFSPDRERLLETTKYNWHRIQSEDLCDGIERVVKINWFDEQLFTVLGTVIIRVLQEHVQHERVTDCLKLFSGNGWLSDQDIKRLSRVRFRYNDNGEKFHRCCVETEENWSYIRSNDPFLSELSLLGPVGVDDLIWSRISLLGHLCATVSVLEYPSAAVLEYLVTEANVNILEEFDDRSIPLLHLAAYSGNVAAVEVLCKVDGINLGARDSFNLNILHMAVKAGQPSVIEAIEGFTSSHLGCELMYGLDGWGMTPLHYAAWEGFEEDLYVEDDPFLDSLHLSREDLVRNRKRSMHLFESGMCDNLDVNAVLSTGLTPLHLASWNNDESTINYLLALIVDIPDNGFNPLHLLSWCNHEGFTPLDLLSWNNHGRTLINFLDRIVPYKVPAERHDLTASDLASWNHIEVVTRLLHHPDVNLEETHDQSFIALHLLQWKHDNNRIKERLSQWKQDDKKFWRSRIQSGSECEQSDVRMSGQYARLGEKPRKSWEDYFDRTESHLLQFSVSRTFQKLRRKHTAWRITINKKIYNMDWRKGPAEEGVARCNWPGDWLLLNLMEGILALKPGPDVPPVVDRLVWFSENSWLSKEDIGRLSHMKVPGVNEGRFSVLGHLCVKKTCSELVLEFLLRTADGNILEEFGGHKIPLLHLAGYYRNDEALSILLRDEKINLLATSSFKLNALHIAVKRRDMWLAERIYNALLQAVKSVARVVVFKRCLADVSEESASLNESEIIRLLVNGKDAFGMTPLHYAVWEGDVNMIDALLGMKMINVNAVDDNGLTPLHLASCIKQLGVVKKLLQYPNIDTSLQSKETMPKAFDLQSKRERVGKDAFEEIEFHLRQFVLDPGTLEEINLMRDELQENDRAEGGALERELRGDEIRRIITKHSETLCWPSHGHGKMTALHCAAWLGHATIVVELMEKISKLPRSRTLTNLVDKYGFSPMHYAVMRGDAGMVEELLSYSKVKGNIRGQTQYGSTPLRIAYLLADGKYFESLVKAYRDDKDVDERGSDDEYNELVRKAVEEYKLIVGMLEEHSDVKAFIDSLYKERQLFIDAANAILVGAALIASISFAGWLQPPLGYQQYYESRYLLTGSAPPDTYASFASVKQHISVTMFWVFNSLSFFFSVATVMAGASVVLPMRGQSELEEHVERIRQLHIWTTLFLCLSVVFVLGAFTAAGFASLPTELEYQWVMISTTAVGGSVTIGTLVYYLRRVSILIKQIWRSRQSKGTSKRGPLQQFFLSLVIKLCIKAYLLISSLFGDIWGLTRRATVF